MTDLSNEIILHNIEGHYLQFRKLLAFPELAHRFVLKPLDFMTSHEKLAEEAETVTAKELGIDRGCFCKPQQTHSDHIRVVGRSDAGILPPQLQDTDGLITNERGLYLLLTFADCTPLLFYDPVKKVIANIHSGWRGTLARIGAKAVEKMNREFKCDPADIICCIGPHLRKCHFEVDGDVYDLFKNEFEEMLPADQFSTYDKSRNKYYIDTALINITLLKSAGLMAENILDCGICTVCHSNLCQSYRADRAASGRSASIIALTAQ